MRRPGTVLALVAGVVLATALPAAAESSRMQLDCGGSLGTIERTNGSSWWGSDGTVYATRYLRVVDAGGVYEKSYGGGPRPYLVCQAEHDVEGYESDWTVHLVPAG